MMVELGCRRAPWSAPEANAMTLRLCLLATLLAPSLVGQSSLAFLQGPTPSNLELRVVDEAAPWSSGRAVLSGLQVAPVEITNRTHQHNSCGFVVVFCSVLSPAR